jgi:hypothetical protein
LLENLGLVGAQERLEVSFGLVFIAEFIQYLLVKCWDFLDHPDPLDVRGQFINVVALKFCLEFLEKRLVEIESQGFTLESTDKIAPHSSLFPLLFCEVGERIILQHLLFHLNLFENIFLVLVDLNEVLFSLKIELLFNIKFFEEIFSGFLVKPDKILEILSFNLQKKPLQTYTFDVLGSSYLDRLKFKLKFLLLRF